MTLVANNKLPLTVLIAAKNEAINLPRCLEALKPAQRVVVLDSDSEDATATIAQHHGAEVVQFKYEGGYPKKRQWALDNLVIETPWVFLLDADEVVPSGLWAEIAVELERPDSRDAYLVRKGFHFLGRPFRYGGFSHAAILLLRTGHGRFEHLFENSPIDLDMEVHERVVVQGQVGQLKTALIHEDFKGLEAYIARHNHYSSWEARLRYHYLKTGWYGETTIKPRLFGNTQERRRFFKSFVVRLPFEPQAWFFYHYFLRLGFLEGRAGLIACQIRSSYIAQTRAKLYELKKGAHWSSTQNRGFL